MRPLAGCLQAATRLVHMAATAPAGRLRPMVPQRLHRGLSSSFGRQASSGSKWRPRHHDRRPTPAVVRAMRERAEAADPQIQQRRQLLEPGHSHYYATCHPGLEEVVAAELRGPEIGAANVHPGEMLPCLGDTSGWCMHACMLEPAAEWLELTSRRQEGLERCILIACKHLCTLLRSHPAAG